MHVRSSRGFQFGATPPCPCPTGLPGQRSAQGHTLPRPPRISLKALSTLCPTLRHNHQQIIPGLHPKTFRHIRKIPSREPDMNASGCWSPYLPGLASGAYTGDELHPPCAVAGHILKGSPKPSSSRLSASLFYRYAEHQGSESWGSADVFSAFSVWGVSSRVLYHSDSFPWHAATKKAPSPENSQETAYPIIITHICHDRHRGITRNP